MGWIKPKNHLTLLSLLRDPRQERVWRGGEEARDRVRAGQERRQEVGRGEDRKGELRTG
jgi:hypothetical protein